MQEYQELIPDEENRKKTKQKGAPSIKIIEGKNNIEILFKLYGIYKSKDTYIFDEKELSFDRVELAGSGFHHEKGKPSLPCFSRYFQIPQNHNFEYSYKIEKQVTLDDFIIAPSQIHLTDDNGKKQNIEYDTKFYKENNLYPPDIIQILGPFLLDGYTALIIRVIPLQYNAKQRLLTCFTEINVTVKLFSQDDTVSDYPINPVMNQEAFGNRFLNPKRSIWAGVDIEPKILKLVQGPELLILYHQSLENAAIKLADWKNKKGLRTEILSIDDQDIEAVDLICQIRRRRMNESRLGYILLLGDVDLIPPYASHVRTDYYYSTDRYYNTDNPDRIVLPMLSVGRIPVNKKEDAIKVINQIIRYEKDPPRDESYYNRMVFAGYFQDSGNRDSDPPDGKEHLAYIKTLERIRSQLVNLGYSIERVYISEYPEIEIKEYNDGTCVPQDVVGSFVDYDEATDKLIRSVAKGQLIMTHRDHGSPEGWSMPNLKKEHLADIDDRSPALPEDRFPTIFFNINCWSGYFDSDPTYNSFSEEILRREGAAPSLIASNRESDSELNDHLLTGMFDAMYGGIIPTDPSTTYSCPLRYKRLGDILNYAKVYLLEAISGQEERIQNHFEIYHVLGDPSLELWTTEPLETEIQAWIREGALHINLSYFPSGAILTIWNCETNERIKRIEPSSRYLKIPINTEDQSDENINVCFYAPGFRYQEVTPDKV